MPTRHPSRIHPQARQSAARRRATAPQRTVALQRTATPWKRRTSTAFLGTGPPRIAAKRSTQPSAKPQRRHGRQRKDRVINRRRQPGSLAQPVRSRRTTQAEQPAQARRRFHRKRHHTGMRPKLTRNSRNTSHRMGLPEHTRHRYQYRRAIRRNRKNRRKSARSSPASTPAPSCSQLWRH